MDEKDKVLGVEDIMMDVRQMPESERRKLKSMLERM